MRKIIQKGEYTLLESKRNTKILILDNKQYYAWINAKKIGEILVKTSQKPTVQNLLSTGRYVIYSVNKDKKLTDLPHLDLEIGNDQWQGYLLLNGLPSTKGEKHRIIPTNELVEYNKHVIVSH